MSDQKLPVQLRTIRMEAIESGDDELVVTGSLRDERPRGGPKWFGVPGPRVVHDMRVALRVRHPDLVITAVDGAMDTQPYTICPEALPPLQQLVGVSVGQGFTRAVNERLGRQQGCSHLTALIQAMGPVIRQAAGAAFRDRNTEAVMGGGGDRWFVNTCRSWRENGPLHNLLKQGDEAGLRAMSTYKEHREQAS